MIWRNEWKKRSYKVTIVLRNNIMKNQLKLNKSKICLIKSTSLFKIFSTAYKFCEYYHFKMFCIFFILCQNVSQITLDTMIGILKSFFNVQLMTWIIDQENIKSACFQFCFIQRNCFWLLMNFGCMLLFWKRWNLT